MKNLDLKAACENARKKMNENSEFLNHYEIIKETIKVLFDENDIDDEFYEYKNEKEVVAFVKGIIGEDVDVEKIEIIPNKTVLIRGNAHYDIDESFSKRSLESYIVKMIGAFTGYAADISL